MRKVPGVCPDSRTEAVINAHAINELAARIARRGGELSAPGTGLLSFPPRERRTVASVVR